MMKGPKISIITACYNAEKTIEQTIQSVITQTYDNIEYIIVDGASSDGTMDIVNKYRDKIDLIISEPDEGIYDAFNKGGKVASGDYIQYLNADDYLIDNNVIENIAEYINNHENAAIIYGGIILKNEVTDCQYVLNKEISYEEFKEGKMIPHPATFTRRDIMLELNFFNTTYKIVSDYELTARIFKKYLKNIFYVPRLVTVFRLGGISSQIQNNNLLNNEMKRIIEDVFKKQYKAKKITNDEFLKKWLEKKLFEQKNITDFLKQNNINNVVIWGTGIISNLLIPELRENNIQIKAFIDNDNQKHGFIMNGVTVYSPEWFIENIENIDAIIFGFEGFHEDEVIKQLKGYNLPKKIKHYSWREIVLL